MNEWFGHRTILPIKFEMFFFHQISNTDPGLKSKNLKNLKFLFKNSIIRPNLNSNIKENKNKIKPKSCDLMTRPQDHGIIGTTIEKI